MHGDVKQEGLYQNCERAGYGKHQYQPCPHAKIEVPPSSNFFGRNYLFSTPTCIKVTFVLENAHAYCEYRIQTGAIFRIFLNFTEFHMFRH
jgi:hypothetical protein